MKTKFLLRHGRLSRKKPEYYCGLHKCGLTRSTMKKQCSRCRHFSELTETQRYTIEVRV